MFIPAAPPLPRLQGTNKHGYLMHLTAAKLLSYGYVTQEETYSRMVSIYGYSRFSEYEA